MTLAGSRFSIFLALLWKDARAILRLAAIPVGAALLAYVTAWLSATIRGESVIAAHRMVPGWLMLVLPPLAAMLLGASAFAGERARGEVPFAEALPGGRFLKALAKVLLNLLVLAALNGLFWWWFRPPRPIPREIPSSLWFWPLSVTVQMLLFGLSHLSSVLVDRPLRVFLVAPAVALLVAGAGICLGPGLFAIALARAPQIRPDTAFCFESFFAAAVIVAALLMLGLPALIERREPGIGSGAWVVCHLLLPALLASLPAVQLYRLWGWPVFAEALKAYEPDPRMYLWVAGGIGVFALGAALALEVRHWLASGVGAGWAGAAGISWAVAGGLLASWGAIALGLGGTFDIHFSRNSGLQTLPGGNHTLVTHGSTFRFGEWLGPLRFPWRADSVLLEHIRGKEIALVGQAPGPAQWSREGRFLAWTVGRPALLHRHKRLAILDTRTSQIRTCRMPGPRSHLVRFWEAEEDRLVMVMMDRVEQAPTCRFYECAMHKARWRPRLLGKWAPEPSGNAWFYPYPTALEPEGEDLVVFVQPMMREGRRRELKGTSQTYPRTDRSPYGLYRINLTSGEARPDPRLAQIRRTVKELKGDTEAHFSLYWSPFFTGESHGRLLLVHGQNKEAGDRWAQIWRLGNRDRASRLLMDGAAYAPAPVAFLTEETYVLGRRGRMDADGTAEWRIMRRSLDAAIQSELLTIPLARHVFFHPSPSREWLVVSASHQSLPDSTAWWKGYWLLATDGSFCASINLGELRLQSHTPGGMVWVGDCELLVQALEGLYAVTPVRQQGQALCKIRQVMVPDDLPDFPSLRLSGPIGNGEVLGLTAEDLWRDEKNQRVYRINVVTGKSELLLRMVNGRWAGTSALTVQAPLAGRDL